MSISKIFSHVKMCQLKKNKLNIESFITKTQKKTTTEPDATKSVFLIQRTGGKERAKSRVQIIHEQTNAR